MKRLLDGDRRALGKLITLIDDGAPEGIEAIVKLFPKTGHAQIIGITGSPGVGKSSLINALTRQLRDRGKTVGIIAVDPSSPFSGGRIAGLQDQNARPLHRRRSLYSQLGLKRLSWRLVEISQ